jgi:hypothetical protein
MPFVVRERWINICPYPGKKDILPVPPPVKHLECVNDMGKNRKPLVDVNRRSS